MATPLIIDTDMGIDDAVAIVLAINADALDLTALVSVGGNVALGQATLNMRRLLGGLALKRMPLLAEGLDHEHPELSRAEHVFGQDGLGEIDLPPADLNVDSDYIGVYEKLIEEHGKSLTIIAIGPLTNLAEIERARPGLLARTGRIIIMGGAVFCPGNVTPVAEFNFYRDPKAAAEVLGAGLPITIVPLDVTRQVALDESHVAHLARSGGRGADLLARMIRYPLARKTDAEAGRFLVHDALAVGMITWPDLFLQARMRLDVTVEGSEAGRSKPVVAKDKSKELSVLMSVNSVDFLENLLEGLCQEEFVV